MRLGLAAVLRSAATSIAPSEETNYIGDCGNQQDKGRNSGVDIAGQLSTTMRASDEELLVSGENSLPADKTMQRALAGIKKAGIKGQPFNFNKSNKF